MLQHAAAHRHQMFYTAHQFSSREGFTERLHSLHTVKATAFSFFLSPWNCKEGRGQHCFSSRTVNTQRRTRDEAHDLSNAVRQITKHKHKDKMLSDQRCGINHNGDRFTANSWPVSYPKVTVLTEPLTSRCCSHSARQSMRWKASTTNTGCISAIMGVWENKVELSPWRNTPVPNSTSCGKMSSLHADMTLTAWTKLCEKPSSTEQEI